MVAKDAPGGHTYSGKIDLGGRSAGAAIRKMIAPFNGQNGRREMFSQIIARHHFAAIVETGTYRGHTTRFMAEESGLPVFSIESNAKAHRSARDNVSGCDRVRLYLGDSVATLRQELEAREIPDRDVLCYLDAHWGEVLPLADEIEIVTTRMTNFVILIDDFQVPDDPGYGYDDYGPGKALCLAYLAPFRGRGLVVFLPSRPSGEENGARRGCIVLTAAATIAAALRKAPSLRDAGPLDKLLAALPAD